MSDLQRFEDGTLPAFAFPGGYPLLYLTQAGLTVCPECANDTEKGEGDPVVAADANWEDPLLYCDDCGERIPSAYMEDEAPR